MRVVVRPHECIQPAVRAWVRSLSDNPDERERLSERLWAEFVATIVDAQGPPPDAYRDESTRPETYWTAFPGDGFAQLLVRPDRRVRLFITEREVLVIALTFSPRLPG